MVETVCFLVAGLTTSSVRFMCMKNRRLNRFLGRWRVGDYLGMSRRLNSWECMTAAPSPESQLSNGSWASLLALMSEPPRPCTLIPILVVTWYFISNLSLLFGPLKCCLTAGIPQPNPCKQLSELVTDHVVQVLLKHHLLLLKCLSCLDHSFVLATTTDSNVHNVFLCLTFEARPDIDQLLLIYQYSFPGVDGLNVSHKLPSSMGILQILGEIRVVTSSCNSMSQDLQVERALLSLYHDSRHPCLLNLVNPSLLVLHGSWLSPCGWLFRNP